MAKRRKSILLRKRWLSAAAMSALALGALAFGGPGCSRSSDEHDAAPGCGDASTSLASAPCSNGHFLYEDQSCGPTPPGAPQVCTEMGDGLCHQHCTTDADCTDPCRGFCRRLGLFRGGDANCNDTVLICRSEDRDDC